MHRIKSRLLVLTLSFATLACSSEHDLLVAVRTDFEPGAEFARVRVELSSETEGEARLVLTRERADISPDENFAAGVRVAEFGALVPGRYELIVTIADAGGRQLGERRAIVDLQSTTAHTALIARSCRTVTCPGAGDAPSLTTCSAGRCVDPRCNPDDPEACGPSVCEADADCPAPDGCLRAECVEGACFDAPDDGSCASSERCSAISGCVPRSMAMDAGPMDAGALDAGALDAGDADDDAGTEPCSPDLSSDPEHCGECDNACAAVNGTAICVGGECAADCDAGFGSCDGDETTCETDLSDSNNCGGCGVSCSGATPLCAPAGGSFACSSGCPSGTTRCGDSCVDTDTSLAHCGSCNNGCDDGNSCTLNQCGSGTCSNPPRCAGTTSSCGCTSCSNCSNQNGWVNVGSPYACCSGGQGCTCQDQQYRTFTCSGTSCTSSVTDTRTQTSGCTSCNDGNSCTLNQCSSGTCSNPPRCAGTTSSCGCTSCTNCSNSNGWVNVGSSYACCSSGQACTCQNQEYRTFTCGGTSCTSSVTDTRVQTSGCSSCNDGNACTLNQCSSGTCSNPPRCAGTTSSCGCESCTACPAPSTVFGPCNPSGECSSSGTQSVTTTTWTCSGGSCQSSDSTSFQSCTTPAECRPCTGGICIGGSCCVGCACP